MRESREGATTRFATAERQVTPRDTRRAEAATAKKQDVNLKRFHQSSIKPPKMSLNTAKPPKRKFLTMLRITFGGLGSFGLKAIRNRQVASSTLALGSKL